MKIKRTKYGIIHAYAQCQNCDWAEGMDISAVNRMQKLRNAINKHIRENKHSVTLEIANSTTYSI